MATQVRQGAQDLHYGRTIDSVTTVAAPLLAGGSAAMLGVVAADADRFRWPGPVLLVLALSVILLVASVQCGFRARSYLYTIAEMEAWYGTPLTEDERAWHLRQREFDLRRWRRNSGLASACYSLGLAALGSGIALVLAPPSPAGPDPGWRWAAFWVVSAAVAADLLWCLLEWGDTVSRARTQRRLLRRAQRGNGGSADGGG